MAGISDHATNPNFRCCGHKVQESENRMWLSGFGKAYGQLGARRMEARLCVFGSEGPGLSTVGAEEAPLSRAPSMGQAEARAHPRRPQAMPD
jgi:hypothetical protein